MSSPKILSDEKTIQLAQKKVKGRIFIMLQLASSTSMITYKIE